MRTEADQAVRRLAEAIVENHNGDPTDRRDIARAVLHLRMECRDSRGYPDLGGRSDQYRRAIKDAYARADLSPGQEDRIKKSVRYYMPPMVRGAIDHGAETLPDDPYGYYLIKPESATSPRSSRKRTVSSRAPMDGGIAQQRIGRIYRDMSALRDDQDAWSEIKEMHITDAAQTYQVLKRIGKIADDLADSIE